MNDFANTLESLYGANSPILLDEIKEAFPNTPPATLYRRLRSAIASSKLAKARKGVYYVPTETRFGSSTLSDAKILEKKYLSDGNEVYGYITGLVLENQLGLSNQAPGTLEIVTNRETTRSRKIESIGGYREITLRRPRVPVAADNVQILQLLDLLTNTPLDRLNSNERENLKKFASKIDRRMLLEYAKYYPNKTAAKLLESEATGVLT